MYFDFNIAPVVAILLIASVVCSVIALAAFLRKILPMHSARRACKRADSETGSFPASIIVYTSDRCENLDTLLQQLLAQQYAPGFEVIVINEGDSLHVRDIVEPLQTVHGNLYLTHTPEGARNLSRKKLAITLGIKAARHPVAVLTAAGAEIRSELWLQHMMRHFDAGSSTEVVLGTATPDPYEDDCAGKRTRSFDTAADTVVWTGDALNGHPWRGTEFNLAYTRDIFFRNKGFSRHLNLRNGDDDVFISEIARGYNTTVELSPESVVVVPQANSPRNARERRNARRFTARFVRRRPSFITPAGWWAYLGALLTACAAAVLAPYNWFVLLCAAAALAVWFAVAMVWRNAITAMNGRSLLLTLPFIIASRPVRSSWRRFISLFRHGKRYTWE